MSGPQAIINGLIAKITADLSQAGKEAADSMIITEGPDGRNHVYAPDETIPDDHRTIGTGITGAAGGLVDGASEIIRSERYWSRYRAVYEAMADTAFDTADAAVDNWAPEPFRSHFQKRLAEMGQGVASSSGYVKKGGLDRYYVSTERHEYDYHRKNRRWVDLVEYDLGIQFPANYRVWVLKKSYRRALEAEKRWHRCVGSHAKGCLSAGGVDAETLESIRAAYVQEAHDAALRSFPEA